jgi:hypothetical protein
MAQREWNCEVCSASGCVEVANASDLDELIPSVSYDHKEKNPDCPANYCGIGHNGIFPTMILYEVPNC